MNKRGQFFLIAAIITIGVIISLAVIINSATSSASQDSFYRRSDEVGFESKRVLDYGVYRPSANLQLDLQTFLEDYADVIGQEQALFLFGDTTGAVTAYYFEQSAVGSVGIATGGASNLVTIQEVTQTEADITLVGSTVSATIEDTTYQFPLLRGQNFYFVIIKTDEEERFVAQG